MQESTHSPASIPRFNGEQNAFADSIPVQYTTEIESPLSRSERLVLGGSKFCANFFYFAVSAAMVSSPTIPPEKELGPVYRDLSRPAVASTQVGPLLIDTLDTPFGPLKRAPLSVFVPFSGIGGAPEKHLADVALVNEFTLDDGSVEKRVVSSWPPSAQNSQIKSYTDEPTNEQAITDRWGQVKYRDGVTMQIPPEGKSSLLLTITNEHNKTETAKISVDPLIDSVCKDTVQIIEQNTMDGVQYDEFCSGVSAMDPYIKQPLYVVSKNAATGRYMADGQGTPTVELNGFPKDIKRYDTGSAITKHELMHAFYDQMSDESAKKFEDIYQELIRISRYRVPMPAERLSLPQNHSYDPADNEPAWALITESTYLREIGETASENGHPYDAATETVASALAVYTTFPDMFLEKFQELLPHEHEIHRQLFDAITSSLTSKNSSPRALRNLIPQYDALYQELHKCTLDSLPK